MITDSALVCDTCDWENPRGSRFCNQCGTALIVPVEADAARELPVEAHDPAGGVIARRQVAPRPLHERIERHSLPDGPIGTAIPSAATLARPLARARHWPQARLGAVAAGSAALLKTLQDRRALVMLIGAAVMLLALVLLGPVVWNSALPVVRRLMIEIPMQLALMAAAVLVVALVVGAASRAAPHRTGAAEPVPIAGGIPRVMRTAVAAWRAPGGLVLALALAAIAEGLLLTGKILPGIVCYGLAALVAWQRALTAPVAHGPPLGGLARRYEIPLALLILGGSTVLRFVMIGAYPAGIEGDEIKWSAAIWYFMVGETDRWPASYFWDQGPLSFLYMPFFFNALGATVGTARVAVATLSTVGNVAFYLLARRALGVPAGLIAALLLGVSLGDLAGSRDSHIEPQVKVWVVLAPFFAAWAVDRLRDWRPGPLRLATSTMVGRLRGLWKWLGPGPLLCFLAGGSLLCGLLVFETFAPIAIVVGLYLGVALLVLLIRAPKSWLTYFISGAAFALPILAGAPRVLRVLYVRQGEHAKFDQAWGPDLLPTPEHAQLVLSYVGKNFNDFWASLFVRQQMGDFFYNRPGPWENAVLLPLLVIGFAWALGRLRHRHNGLIILWAVLVPIPGAIVVGFAAYRIVYPVAPALCLLMAIGLWASFEAFASTWPRSWRPGLTACLVGLLGAVALVSSYIYFRELPSFDDRLQMRELTDLVEENVAPGRMVLMTYVVNSPDFIRNNQEISQAVTRGVVGAPHVPAALRHVAYPDLLPSIFALRGRYADVRVIVETRQSGVGTQPQEILSLLGNCFPGASIYTGRFAAVYTIPDAALANTRCLLNRSG